MKRLVEPAVRAARQGFPLTDFQAYLFTVIAPILTASQGVARIFAPDGKPMTGGRRLSATRSLPRRSNGSPRTARGSSSMAMSGKAIVAQSRDQGGYLTHDDLARYRVERREPLYWRHGDAAVALNPPPAASGALIAFGLGFLAALGEHGRAIDAFALRAAMEATNEARANHGETLAARLAAGHLAKEIDQAARHPACLSRHHACERDRRGRKRRRHQPLQRRGQRLSRRQDSASC